MFPVSCNAKYYCSDIYLSSLLLVPQAVANVLGKRTLDSSYQPFEQPLDPTARLHIMFPAQFSKTGR